MKKLNIVIVLFFSLLVLQSCVKKIEVDEGVAPALPLAETFIMPFTGYEEVDTTGFVPTDEDTAAPRTDTHFNWFHAATNVFIWNTIVNLNLVIPKAAFFAAFNHDAVAQGNGVWLWEYSFTGDSNNIYTAKLYGEVLDMEEVQWDMYISKENGFQDVHWYSGITSAAQATWALNHKPNSPEPLLKIEYQKNNGSGEAAIKYTNIVPNNAGNGDYIEFRVDNASGADFDRGYDIYKSSNGNLLEAQWNEAIKNGQVKDEQRFGDTKWHCWGESQIDIEC
ncbi:MAG: hypothetical protein ACI9CQ_001122 [Saprospiraceae bacterium]|jgi:hypothetical protein